MLKDLIVFLESMPQAARVKHGFGHAMSWRGDYSQLAFAPEDNVLISDMLKEAKDAVGKIFDGYKGGTFKMNEFSDCYISEYGNSSGDRIGPTIMSYWRGDCNV